MGALAVLALELTFLGTGTAAGAPPALGTARVEALPVFGTGIVAGALSICDAVALARIALVDTSFCDWVL